MNRKIDKVIDRMINIGAGALDESCPISIIDINKWEWAQGVGLYGMYRYYEVSGDKSLLDFMRKWYDKRISEGLPEKCVNTIAPLLPLTYIHGNKKEYLDLMYEWADWLYREHPRTLEGGITHTVSGVSLTGQLWDDTLFMAVLFLARAGIIFNKKEWLDETKKQFLVHLKYLTDKKTGLMFHGWSFERRDHFSAALWGRGNCWLTVGIPDYIDIMEGHLEGFVKDMLVSAYAMQVEALKDCQEETGEWHTLLDDKTSYIEISATAGFCYGIYKGVRKGYIGKEYLPTARRALDAVIRNIAEDGTVLNVSYGTGICKTLKEYKEIEITPMTYGQALAVLCMSESMNAQN